MLVYWFFHGWGLAGVIVWIAFSVNLWIRSFWFVILQNLRLATTPPKTGPIGIKNNKNYRKTEKSFFHKNCFFDNFKLYLGGLGVSGGMAWTIRCDSLELWQDLVLHGIGKSIFMFFGNIGNSLHHQIPPNWFSGLQIGPRSFLKARAPSQEL